jgi:hypothetical protein
MDGRDWLTEHCVENRILLREVAYGLLGSRGEAAGAVVTRSVPTGRDRPTLPHAGRGELSAAAPFYAVTNRGRTRRRPGDRKRGGHAAATWTAATSYRAGSNEAMAARALRWACAAGSRPVASNNSLLAHCT